MTVDELIAALQEFDPDAQVTFAPMGMGRRIDATVSMGTVGTRSGHTEAVILSPTMATMPRGPVRPLAPEVIAERKAAAKAKRENKKA